MAEEGRRFDVDFAPRTTPRLEGGQWPIEGCRHLGGHGMASVAHPSTNYILICNKFFG